MSARSVRRAGPPDQFKVDAAVTGVIWLWSRQAGSRSTWRAWERVSAAMFEPACRVHSVTSISCLKSSEGGVIWRREDSCQRHALSPRGEAGGILVPRCTAASRRGPLVARATGVNVAAVRVHTPTVVSFP